MSIKTVIFLILAAGMLPACQAPDDKTSVQKSSAGDTTGVQSYTAPPPLFTYIVPRTILVKDYFPFIDSLVLRYDSLVPYPLTEHLLVRSNPRIIDTLEDTDYYRRMARGEFVYDQRQLPVLHQGDTLYIPDTASARALLDRMAGTWIDINIPEYTLRVVEGQDTVQCMTIRVGQNKKRYQEVLGRVDDLRTRPGIGTIVRINRAPTLFYDPHTGRKFTHTKRDDGRTTRMPLIPWMEPEINGIRMGQMIHPTTNPETLGKAYSNGCIGCTEGEAWRLYYYAPVGTKVVIRYDLVLIGPLGDTTRLPDIYGWAKRKTGN